jgi:hypothetical protein
MYRPRPGNRDVERIRWLANSHVHAQRIECRRPLCSRVILSQRPSLTLHYRITRNVDIQQCRDRIRPTFRYHWLDQRSFLFFAIWKSLTRACLAWEPDSPDGASPSGSVQCWECVRVVGLF